MRNHDPAPGPPTIWEGYLQLGERAAAYETLRDLQVLALRHDPELWPAHAPHLFCSFCPVCRPYWEPAGCGGRGATEASWIPSAGC